MQDDELVRVRPLLEPIADWRQYLAEPDADIWHTFRTSKRARLPLDWYKALPRHLDEPQAVILDMTRPQELAFLLLYSSETEASKKLVVRIDYRLKKGGERNLVETGKMVDPAGIRAMLGHGYEIVEGSL